MRRTAGSRREQHVRYSGQLNGPGAPKRVNSGCGVYRRHPDRAAVRHEVPERVRVGGEELRTARVLQQRTSN